MSDYIPQGNPWHLHDRVVKDDPHTDVMSWRRVGTHIVVMHNAELCPIPQDAWAEASELYDLVVREILSLSEGKTRDEVIIPENLGVEWKLVMRDKPENPWHCHKDVLRGLNDRGVEHVVPNDDAEAVNRKIQSDIWEQLLKIARLPLDQQRQQIVAILTGDSDYSSVLAKLVSKTHAQLVFIHPGNLLKSMLDTITTASGGAIKPAESGEWKMLVEMVAKNPGWSWSSAEAASKDSVENDSNTGVGDSKSVTVFVQPAQGFYISRKLIRSLIQEIYNIDRRLVVSMGMNKDRIQVYARHSGPGISRSLQRAEAHLEEFVNTLLVRKLFLKLPRDQILSSEVLTFASHKDVGIWIPGRGRDSVSNYQSGVRIAVPMYWDKKRTFDVARNLAASANVTIHNVLKPPEPAYELMQQKGSTTIGWPVIPDKNVHDEKSWEEIAVRLIAIPPQRVEEGQEPIKFIGDSIFAQRTSSVTPVILVSKSNNEEGIESVRQKLQRDSDEVDDENESLDESGGKNVKRIKCYSCFREKDEREGVKCSRGEHFKCSNCLNDKLRSSNQDIKSAVVSCDSCKCNRVHEGEFLHDDIIGHLGDREKTILTESIDRSRADPSSLATSSSQPISREAVSSIEKEGGTIEQEVQKAVSWLDEVALQLEGCPNCSFRIDRRFKCPCCCCNFCPLCLEQRGSDMEAEGCAMRCLKKRNRPVDPEVDYLSIRRQEKVEECLNMLRPEIRKQVIERAKEFFEDHGVELQE